MSDLMEHGKLERSLLEHEGVRYERIHVVEHVDDNAGFFAMVTYALNGIRKALENRWRPVIRFDGRTARWFHDPARGDDVWETYFEPVMGLSWRQVEAALDRGELSEKDLHRYEECLVLSWHQGDPERIATFWARDEPEDPAAWMAEKRALGRRFVQRFLHVQPHVLERVERVAAEHRRRLPRRAARFLFGAHLRGTDFAYAEPTPPERYVAAIRRLAEERGLSDFGVFVATDQEQFVEILRGAFGERVVTSDAMRSSGAVPPFKMKELGPYRRGEDVLVDALLLSRCDHVLKGAAAAGEYALWLNPRVEFTDFALESAFDPRFLPYLEPAFLKLNTGDYGPVRRATVRGARALWARLTAPWRLLRRALRFARRLAMGRLVGHGSGPRGRRGRRG